MSKSAKPPVPPAGRSDKGPGDAPKSREKSDLASAGNRPANLAEQDRQGNIRQNTTHKGTQQDR